MFRLLIALAVTPAAFAACAEVIWPDSLDVQQQAAAPAADSMVSYTDPPLRLTGVTISHDPPSQNRKVKPFSVKSTQAELHVSWRLPESSATFICVAVMNVPPSA